MLREKPADLLREVEAELVRASFTRGGLLSLKAELLAILGQGPEALVVAQQALSVLEVERSWRIFARAHYAFVLHRVQTLERAA